jgi:hypothetical protein
MIVVYNPEAGEQYDTEQDERCTPPVKKKKERGEMK